MTDGINEANNSVGEEFGMDRFMKVLESYKLCSPTELTAETLKRLEQFVDSAPQFDDITLLTMKWTPTAVDKISYNAAEAVHAN